MPALCFALVFFFSKWEEKYTFWTVFAWLIWSNKNFQFSLKQQATRSVLPAKFELMAVFVFSDELTTLSL